MKWNLPPLTIDLRRFVLKHETDWFMQKAAAAYALKFWKLNFLLQGSDLNALMLVYNIGSVVCGVDEKLKMDLSVESTNPISIWYGLCWHEKNPF